MRFISYLQDIYYSRKNFKRPELQVTPHRTFKEEAETLDNYFPSELSYTYFRSCAANCMPGHEFL